MFLLLFDTILQFFFSPRPLLQQFCTLIFASFATSATPADPDVHISRFCVLWGRVWGWGDMCKILTKNALFTERSPARSVKMEYQMGILHIGGGDFDNLMHFFS